ncbi:MAG: hypothetical protein JNL82_14375 [Myxococcales bacterium]|nr:hypothetical protein [Myxococcales bacterium]
MKHLDNSPAFFITTGRSGRPAVGVRCSKCSAEEIGADKPTFPPNVIAKHFIARGWDVYRDGASATCPTCAATSRAPAADDAAVNASLARQQLAEQRRLAAANSKPPQEKREPVTSVSTTDTIRAQARLHQLLAEHFNGDGNFGTYDEGWDDKRVAKDSGLAVTEVARVRDVAYGRIKDPILARVEAAITEEKQRAAREFAELRDLITAAETGHAERLSALERQLAERSKEVA